VYDDALFFITVCTESRGTFLDLLNYGASKPLAPERMGPKRWIVDGRWWMVFNLLATPARGKPSTIHHLPSRGEHIGAEEK